MTVIILLDRYVDKGQISLSVFEQLRVIGGILDIVTRQYR